MTPPDVRRARKLETELDGRGVSAERDPSGALPAGQDASAGRIGWGHKALKFLEAGASIAMVVSLIYLSTQSSAALDAAQSAATQAEVAVEALEAQTRAADWEFLGDIQISVGESGISVVNGAEVALHSVAYWYLQEEDAHLVELEGVVSGLASCSTTLINWGYFNALLSSDGAAVFAPNDVGDQELYLAVQAPSGNWFLRGMDGSIMAIELPSTSTEDRSSALPQERWPSDVAQGLIVDPYEFSDVAEKALHEAHLYATAPDTYWGGYDGVKSFAAPVIYQVSSEITGGYDSEFVSFVAGSCA